MDTRPFMTRTIFEKRRNPVININNWIIGIDMGYSGVKIQCPNGDYAFPFYAKKLPKDYISLGKPEWSDILIRIPATGDVWAVGKKALSMISIEATNDSNATLYGRNRYYSEMFGICQMAGLGLALLKNDFGDPTGKNIYIQTGLPPKYIADDAELLREAFAVKYKFDLKIGSGEWMNFDFSIEPSAIGITQQPMGSLVSVAINKDGKPTSDAEKLYKSNVLVFDPGFRTGDCCLFKKGDIDPEDCQTFDNLSMISVLQGTCDEIYTKFGFTIPVPAIQTYLETGYIKKFDKKNLRSDKYDFSSILEAKSAEVCNEAIVKLTEVYNYFQEIDFLILTGGTGAAWHDIFKERLKDLHTLTIIPGNRNEELSRIFSNVRGYYMYAINSIR